MFLYLFMPVPAGISLPIMIFSLRPSSLSFLPLMAASVRTLVVSWNEAADRNELVASEALVIPVSYTHLDVYKRQVKKLSEHLYACYYYFSLLFGKSYDFYFVSYLKHASLYSSCRYCSSSCD